MVPAGTLSLGYTAQPQIMIRKIIVCALLALPVAGICQKSKKAKPVAVAGIDYKVLGSPMPPLRIVTIDRKSVTTASVAGNSSLVVMMFNPVCGHCAEMTMAMEQNLSLFKKTPIVLVAAAGMFDYLKDFRKDVKADNYPALQIGVDSAQFIDKAFNYNGLPQVNIYDKDRKLIKTFSMITTIDSIKAFIE